MKREIYNMVEYARTHSPYYRERLQGLPESDWSFDAVPITVQADYWQANSIKHNQVLTGSHADGIMFKSGGTTGNPKFSFYSRTEWEQTTEALAQGLSRNGLETGDRVANLFYAGSLYSSFIAINNALGKLPGIVQYPLAGSADFSDILHILQDFSVNVLIGTPTTILRFAEYVVQQQVNDLVINKLFYAGETMYADQRQFLESLWPGVVFRSSTYASVDGGIIAYADVQCGFNEHRTFEDYCYLEILDGEGCPIQEMGVEGNIVVTNLIRRLMPLIRYPSGDKGMWLEPEGTPGRKFSLLGRSEESVRIGPMSLYVKDIVDGLHCLGEEIKWSNFQMVIVHEEKMDRLILNIQAENLEDSVKAEDMKQRLQKKVYEIRPMFLELLEKQCVHPLKIQWVTAEAFIINKRTGKLPKVVDQRFD